MNITYKRFVIAFILLAIIGCSSNKIDEVNLKKTYKEVSLSSMKLNVVAKDSLALVAIYNATQGQYWYGKNQWLENKIEFWKGVDTDIVNGERRVVRLNLGVMNLDGRLPDEIGNLTALKRLLLSENKKLVGPLPEGLYNLESLETLIIKFSGIEGGISSSISKLTNLDTLDLWGDLRYAANHTPISCNRLSGYLPKELGELKKLRFLRIGRNDFEGELPNEIGKMENLNFFDFADCKIEGGIPKSFGKMNNLVTMFASGNRLTKPIPEDLCNAEKLEILYLNDNRIEGQIPRNIDKLKNLRTFSISNNKISGTIPKSISKNMKLGLLYLDNNNLSGKIPKEIAHERCRLTYANLSNNNLIGELPEFPGNPYIISEIWYPVIDAQNNRLSGKIPWHYMRWLDIAKQRLLPQQSGYKFTNLK